MDDPDQPYNPNACSEYRKLWDLRIIKDISSVDCGTLFLGHFWVVDVTKASVTLLFGDPSPSSEMSGLIQIKVGEGIAKNKSEIEISFTTVMFNPKENRHAFSKWTWTAHILYSRMLLQNGAMWVCWPRLWGILKPDAFHAALPR